MIDYLVQNFWTLWAVLAMVCLVMEMSSGDFYITCFGIGAVCSLVVSLFAVPFWAQVTVFAVFSVLSIYCIRPHLVKMLDANGLLGIGFFKGFFCVFVSDASQIVVALGVDLHVVLRICYRLVKILFCML